MFLSTSNKNHVSFFNSKRQLRGLRSSTPPKGYIQQWITRLANPPKMSSSKRSRSRSREASGKLIRLATADGSLETSAGSSLTLLPRMEESFEEWLKRQKQIGMKMVETLEKTKAMKDKKEIPKPKSPKQSFEECLKRRKHKWTKISSSSSSSASSSQSSRSRSREASGKLIRLATADGSLETSAGSSLTLLPRMEESFEEWLKRQKQIGMKMVETLEKTKVMKDKKEIPKPKSPKQSFEECLKRRKHKSSSSSASSSQSSLRSREARRLAAAKRCANRLKRKQKNDAKKLKDAAERESKENLKRISRIAELEETIRKQEIDTISRIAELEETIRKQEVDAKKLKDAAERESKENLKKKCRIAELEETLRKLQASFKGTLQALEEKRAQLSEENMRLKTDLEMKKTHLYFCCEWCLLAVWDGRQLACGTTWRKRTDAESLLGILAIPAEQSTCYHQFWWGGSCSGFWADETTTFGNTKGAKHPYLTQRSCSVGFDTCWVIATRWWFEIFLQRSGRQGDSWFDPPHLARNRSCTRHIGTLGTEFLFLHESSKSQIGSSHWKLSTLASLQIKNRSNATG